jgi:hypothetical protein
MLLDHSPRGFDRLARPLLSDPASPSVPQRRGRGHRALRRAIVQVCSQLQLAKIGELRRPELAAAEEHVRFFLPKDARGGLLPLRCSEEEFSAHVGAGVALYMRFVRMTGYVFAAAAVVALPQIVGNVSGTRLHLRWPWSDECEAAVPEGTPPVSRVAAQVTLLSPLPSLAPWHPPAVPSTPPSQHLPGHPSNIACPQLSPRHPSCNPFGGTGGRRGAPRYPLDPSRQRIAR